ncbi:hypothetical protein ACDI16_07240 [Oceanobacillus caeni]|uniref:hypothetical protein n=1 Tax=Virgibacillus sp. SK37 TaxID=403957 RepID=UPI0011A1A8F7|nr:hypothetical protein [Virgibacillus sp. SK37]
MENKLGKINDNANNTLNNLDILDGQMAFFGHLIEDMNQYPEVSAHMVKHGEVQKQLNAIFNLFHYQLEEIAEYQETISKLSTREGNNEQQND